MPRHFFTPTARELNKLSNCNRLGLCEQKPNELPKKRPRTQHWNVVPPVVPVVPVRYMGYDNINWAEIAAALAADNAAAMLAVLKNVDSLHDPSVSVSDDSDVSDSDVSGVSYDDNNANKIRHADAINWSGFSKFIKEDRTNPMGAKALWIEFEEELDNAKREAEEDIESLRRLTFIFGLEIPQPQ